jgi:AraC-like DNA-binding protein
MLEDRSAQHRRIADIAYAVGFNDLSNFNHAFRQHFGRTPSEVRRGS